MKSAQAASQGSTCEVVTRRFLPCEIVSHGCSQNKIPFDNKELARTNGLCIGRCSKKGDSTTGGPDDDDEEEEGPPIVESSFPEPSPA